MKFRINLAILGLLIILLSNETSAEFTQRKLEETVFNNLQSLIKLIPDPAGKILTTVTGTFFSFYVSYFLDQKKVSERFDEIERLIIQQAKKVVERVTSEIIGEIVVKDLQKLIDYFNGYLEDRVTKCLLRPKCKISYEDYDRHELLDHSRRYRTDLKQLVTSTTAENVETTKVRKLSTIFDYIIHEYTTKV